MPNAAPPERSRAVLPSAWRDSVTNDSRLANAISSDRVIFAVSGGRGCKCGVGSMLLGDGALMPGEILCRQAPQLIR